MSQKRLSNKKSEERHKSSVLPTADTSATRARLVASNNVAVVSSSDADKLTKPENMKDNYARSGGTQNQELPQGCSTEK